MINTESYVYVNGIELGMAAYNRLSKPQDNRLVTINEEAEGIDNDNDNSEPEEPEHINIPIKIKYVAQSTAIKPHTISPEVSQEGLEISDDDDVDYNSVAHRNALGMNYEEPLSSEGSDRQRS